MAEPARADDWQLLAEVGERRAAMATLFERHRHYVYRLAWGFVGEPQLAEDVTQEVFLRLARPRRLVPRARFTTWLYKVTLNVARELRRRRDREAPLDDEAAARRPAPVAPGQDVVLTDLARALAALPGRQREAVVMRYLEGMSTRETAQVMSCREGTVKAHLHRAIGALRQVLAGSPQPQPRAAEISLNPQRREP